MSLLSHVKGRYRSLSIIGMAKNAGKTAALNSIIHEASRDGLGLGLTSIGRDGEPVDIATSTPKPLIHLPLGTLIATASSTLERGDCLVEILENTGMSTPMGDIIIARVIRAGYGEIAGPSTNLGLRLAYQSLCSYGPDLVIFDGAIDRSSLASPSVAEACVLATGAVLSRSIDKIAEQTAHKVDLLSLQGLLGPDKRACLRAMDLGSVSIIDKDLNINPLEVKTALSAGSVIGQSLREDSKYLVISGALTKSTISQMLPSLMKFKDVEVVVYDGTKVFIDAMDWKTYKKYGISFKSAQGIKIASITVNPYSPEGYYIDSRHLIKALKEMIKDIEIYDVMGV